MPTMQKCFKHSILLNHLLNPVVASITAFTIEKKIQAELECLAQVFLYQFYIHSKAVLRREALWNHVFHSVCRIKT